jgi:hypothetical protein
MLISILGGLSFTFCWWEVSQSTSALSLCYQIAVPGQPASRPDLPLRPRVPFGMSDLGDMPNMGSKTCLHLQAAFNSGGT